MILDHITTGGQIGGALSYSLPPSANQIDLSAKSDKQVAKTVAQHLLAAVKTAHDPQLKSNLSQALASLHKYLAQDSAEEKKAQAPKVNGKAVVKANSANPKK